MKAGIVVFPGINRERDMAIALEAACGAKPLAFTLALALPRAEEAWLAPFAQGLALDSGVSSSEIPMDDATHAHPERFFEDCDWRHPAANEQLSAKHVHRDSEGRQASSSQYYNHYQ